VIAIRILAFWQAPLAVFTHVFQQRIGIDGGRLYGGKGFGFGSDVEIASFAEARVRMGDGYLGYSGGRTWRGHRRRVVCWRRL